MGAKTTTTFHCDICNADLGAIRPTPVHAIRHGYMPVEEFGVSITIGTYGIPSRDTIVCDACQRAAIAQLHAQMNTPATPVTETEA